MCGVPTFYGPSDSVIPFELGREAVAGWERQAEEEAFVLVDEKAMAQIYRCLMVQGQMTGGVGSVVGC
ncbi:hypothetical protein ACLOJK_010737 [Asimina triloba]